MLASDLGGGPLALHEMCSVYLPHPGLGQFEGRTKWLNTQRIA
jgi:hypothetical protein